MVTRVPTANNSKKSLLLTENSCFFISKKRANAIKANPILYQTKWIASSEISFPRIPVNPKITTIMCTDFILWFFRILYID